jgi:EmrB/QacA subfamily drug resistance transporter
MTEAQAYVASPPKDSRRWWILIVMCIAQLMVILDATIVNIALPSAQRALHFTNADRQWIITAYALAFGSLLLIGGRLTDTLGRKQALLIGLAGFGVASAVGGASTSVGMLVAARGVQGAFGALLTPAVLAVVTTSFTDDAERGKAFGVFGGVAAVGAAVGLLLGGVLTEYASWRWTLYVNVGFAAAACAGASVLLSNDRSHQHRRFDVLGTGSITLGLFGLVYGFSNANRHGWTDTLTLVALGVGAALVLAFLIVEDHIKNPILPLRILASRNRGGALLTLFLAGVGLFSELLFLTYYLQQNLGYSPLKAGLAFLPQTGGTLVAATIGSGYLLKKLSGRVVIPASLLVAAGGIVWLAQIGVNSSYAADILAPVVLIGAGAGLAFTAAINLGVAGVENEDVGVASATVNAMQQIGGSVGPSLFNTIAASTVASYLVSHAASATSHASVLNHATVHSYSVAFWITGAIFAGGAIATVTLLRGHEPAENRQQDAPVAALAES